MGIKEDLFHNVEPAIRLLTILFVGIQIGSDFSEQATTKQTIDILQPSGNTLYLDMKQSAEDDLDVTYVHHRKVRFGDWTMISKDDKSFRLGYPELTIVKSETNNFEIVAIKSAQGFDKKEATYRAKNINYGISQIDSTVQFNSFFDIEAMDKLRGQNVKILLKVPLNKTIYLSKRMEKIIFDIDNVNDALDSDMVNRKWIMTSKGLECIDCNGLENVHKY